MNNELYSEISDPDKVPRGSPSFVQCTLQDRLQNRINRLLDDDSVNTTGPLDERGRQVTDLKRRVDRLSARVDNATRLSALLRHNLVSLGRCLNDFIAADVRAVMRRLVNEINANRDCLHRLSTAAVPLATVANDSRN